MMNIYDRHIPTTYAAIVFKGENLDPDTITSLVKQTPTLVYKKGEIYTINDREQIRRFGLWVYNTRNILMSDSLEKHLDLIEEIFIGTRAVGNRNRLHDIKNFIANENIRLTVDIFWHGDEASSLPEIGNSLAQIVEMAGGTVEADFHRDGDETAAA